MKLSPRLKKSIRIAAPVLLALLLTIAILTRLRLGAAAVDRQEDRARRRARRSCRSPGGPARSDRDR